MVGPYTVFYYLSFNFYVVKMDIKMNQQNTMPDEIVGWIYAGFFNCAKQLPVSDMGDTQWERYVRAKLYWDLLESWSDLKIKYGVAQERADLHTDLLKQARHYLDGVAHDAYDNRLVCEIIHNIDKILGEQKDAT